MFGQELCSGDWVGATPSLISAASVWDDVGQMKELNYRALAEFSLSALSFPSTNTNTAVHYNKGQPSPLSSNWRAEMAAGLAHNGFPQFGNRSRPGESLSEFTGCSSGATTTTSTLHFNSAAVSSSLIQGGIITSTQGSSEKGTPPISAVAVLSSAAPPAGPTERTFLGNGKT